MIARQTNHPAVILVRPQLAENIGMCARAMANCGIETLLLVQPRAGWRNEKTDAAASGASWILDNARVYPCLAEAAAPYTALYAATRRHREISQRQITPTAAATEIMTSAKQAAWVFGPERDGLSNDDLVYCHTLITIPVSCRLPSLNLAQAVFSVCHAHFLAGHSHDEAPQPAGGAPVAQLDHFVTSLLLALRRRGFFRSPHGESRYRRMLYALFKQMESRELKTLAGVVKTLQKPPLS